MGSKEVLSARRTFSKNKINLATFQESILVNYTTFLKALVNKKDNFDW